MDTNIDNYFAEYEDLEIHEIMLTDRARQNAYHQAVMKNAAMFKDKVVLDVGAGTGILSAFCAKAGARMVYAVEASNLAKIALQVIEENQLTAVVKARKLKVVHSKIEEFELPSSADKVDIIISEWMGFYLLHEGMLDSVLYARNKFLKPEGLIFPNEALIYVAPCSVPSRFDYWNDVDGICMSKFASKLREQKSGKPEIVHMKSTDLLHEGVVLYWINLTDVSVAELDEISFKDVVTARRGGNHQGFCIWFECRFPNQNYEDTIVLSTSPDAPETHWKQCVVVLPETACDEVEENSPIAFQISMKRNPNDQRKYNLEVEILDPNDEEHPVPCDCHLTKCILTKAHLLSMDTN